MRVPLSWLAEHVELPKSATAESVMAELVKVVRDEKKRTESDVQFTYFSKSIPKFLKLNPSGNYERALRLVYDSIYIKDRLDGDLGHKMH